MQKFTYLDVGAANDVDPKFLRLVRTGQARYVGFEPDSRSEVEIGQQTFPWALGSREGLATLHLTRKPELSSFLRPNESFTQEFHRPERFEIVGSQRLQLRTLDSFLPQIRGPIYLKIDVQGYEAEVLRGAQKMLRNCLALEVEVEFSPVYQNQPLFGDIDSLLRECGFEFEDYLNLVRWVRAGGYGPGKLVVGQALYVARDLDRRVQESPEDMDAATQIFGALAREDLLSKLGLPIPPVVRSLRRTQFWKSILARRLGLAHITLDS